MAMNAHLPPGWEARWDDSYGRYYFINHSTQDTTWTDPRLAHVGAQNYRPVEQIPMQEFSSRQSSAQSRSTGQTSSAARAKETGFQFSIDPSNDEDDEDEEWRDALLRSSMENNQKKRLMFHEKINMKEKFKRQFKELDAHVVENTVEKHDYDEDIIRATLESLKDAHLEKERRKRQAEERKRKEKEAEEKRKSAERKNEMERIKKELRAKREAERKAELEAERRRAAAAAAAQQRASLLAFTVETRRISQQKTTQPKDTQRPQTSRQKVEPKRPPAKTSTAPKPPAGKQVYISPNRLQPVGPQASLRKGPDRSQLVRHYTRASGANKALVSGPQRTNRKGPSAVQSKVSLSKGPQASLRQGAQCGLVHGQQRSTITGHQSPMMSVV